MPEGPEIHLAADQLRKALAGSVAHDVQFAFDHLQHYEDVLRGRHVHDVTARGKAMLIHFEGDITIYSHNQLYGKWMIRDARDYPDTNRQLRLAIHSEHASALLYSASEIEVLHNGEVDSHPYLSKLGPDALNPEVTTADVVARLKDDRFRRRRFTSLLLDQSFVAGLGNYLRSEILFVAGIYPNMRPVDCSEAALERIATAILDLARQSYRTHGITNDLAQADSLRESGYAWRDYRFWVFNRDDRACFRCETPIIRETLGGRRCYYCPSCQPVTPDEHARDV